MEQGINEVIVNELSIQFKNLELIDECINDVKNALVDISKVYKEEQKNIDEIYQRGLDDAWECVRKIVNMPEKSYWELFGDYRNELFSEISAAEAIAKLKAYEEKKADEVVKRGDVVRNKVNGLTYIVTLASEGGYVLLDSDGNFGTSCITNSFEKTGKHVDIEKILEEMKE